MTISYQGRCCNPHALYTIRMANWMYVILFWGALLIDQTQGYDISLNGNAVRNQPLEMYLNIGTITTGVTLNREDGSSAGSCLAPLGGVSSGCNPGLTQDLTTGTTTYSTTSVSRATDQGVWTSSHGSDSGSINITVLTIPTVNVSQSVSSLKLSSDSKNTQKLTITVTCAYPGVSLDLFFVPTGGGTAVNAPSSTSNCIPTGNTGCTDTDANSYTCDITPQYEASLLSGTEYYVQVAVNLDGQYQSIGLTPTITDTQIIVQAPPVCDCIASIALMSLSIVITVITVVLLVVLYLAVYGKKEGLSVFRPKDKKSTKSARCELTKKSYLVIAIAITVISVIGFIIAVVGYVVCLGCDLNNNGETIGLILAVVGFVLTIVGLVVAVVLSALIGCGIIKIKTDENINVKDGSGGQETNKTPLEQNLTTARSTGSPTSTSKILTRLPNNKVSDSNDSDGDSSTPRGKLDLVPRNRKLPPLEKPSELKPISVSLNNPTYDGQVINAQEQESTEVKKLKGKNKRKKLRKQKEETEKENYSE